MIPTKLPKYMKSPFAHHENGRWWLDDDAPEDVKRVLELDQERERREREMLRLARERIWEGHEYLCETCGLSAVDDLGRFSCQAARAAGTDRRPIGPGEDPGDVCLEYEPALR